ncbi:hypothetical protein, partial [Mycobacterium avium]
MSLARFADAHPDLVDGGFDLLSWRTGISVEFDGQLRTDDLHEVGSGERRLVDCFGGGLNVLGHQHCRRLFETPWKSRRL